jgi:hypothetical protein
MRVIWASGHHRHGGNLAGGLPLRPENILDLSPEDDDAATESHEAEKDPEAESHPHMQFFQYEPDEMFHRGKQNGL